MTDFASLLLPDRGDPAHALLPLAADGFEAWLKDQSIQVRTLAAAAGFKAKPGELLVLPGRKDGEWSAAFGAAKTPGPWDLAAVAQKLPAGTYRIEGDAPLTGGLGWLLVHHRFDRYLAKPDPIPARILLSRDAAAIAPTVALADAVALVRDLVDTPAADMGPAELADAAEAVAKAHGAEIRVTKGDALDQGYPMIAAVGRAAVRDRAPRLIELEWGDPSHPRVAIVGKGVCFDSGGLDLKPSSAMLLMKKDMGGAAHALALAGLVMGARLPVRLHLLIPAVENAVAGDAFRPGDILRSRKGISVEIGNTDAEGRLVLGDALARAGEDKPVLILDFATLTGAARVALGPDLPALFANDDTLAADIAAAAAAVSDPVWRMPLWSDYGDMIKSTMADINNAGEGGMAGAVTAALFLQRFVPDTTAWAHFDTFAWRPSARPGRPKGGDALGLRAAFAMLKAKFVTP
ncbi:MULTISPECIES: leucyl aminopeptidase family protein [unclassified Sphingomonas]|uniref:leucyl aminopeptidase family protein n=1 Tax=unclassified Sphingomonas TaxID=196159 RepID=UPI0006FE77B5|nr:MULTISPECIES: leucyl aminopeptidase family protein [unclassified Sphingomonas]KQX20171.1 aminopeptidase [Sphingomonas sp. Root1294]KQY67421.1 aminopeptidase [Sphingomonas sp. Root50]KRB90797.1 aminopeptidase [Sphingomonas sp. Root720]